MKIGYARVSTDDQNLDLQKDALTRAECSRIYEEHKSGKSLDRPELDACRKALRAGDILAVWRLDRLGRSLPDLIHIIGELRDGGIGFESITEKIDTTTATGELTFHIFAALAQFERQLIRERTRAGLAAARARGRKGGRPTKLTTNDTKAIKSLVKAGELTMSEIAKRFNVHRSTIYKALELV
jgi:DNA invertase Pin-like site-specific DNA recombinase